MTDQEVLETFEDKIQNLHDQYQSCDKEYENSYVKIINMGKSVEIVKIVNIQFINVIKFL